MKDSFDGFIVIFRLYNQLCFHNQIHPKSINIFCKCFFITLLPSTCEYVRILLFEYVFGEVKIKRGVINK
jgi:hypothetical protein